MKILKLHRRYNCLYWFWRIDGDEKTYIPDINISNREGYIHKELLKGNFVGAPSILLKKL